MPQTADGFPLVKGESYWIRSSVVGDPPHQRVYSHMAESGKKIFYDKPDNDGYVGAKLTSVFQKKENAYWDENKSVFDQ